MTGTATLPKSDPQHVSLVVNTNRNIGLYLQDAWNVGRRVTLNLGVRYDNYVLGWPASSNTPNQTAFWSPARRTRKRSFDGTRSAPGWARRGT